MEILYKEFAGLFDFYFTEQDYKLIILILFTWLVKMYIQRKNVLVKTPKIDDYISTLVVQYLTIGVVYELIIYSDKPLPLFLIPITVISIFSIDFILYISSNEEGKIRIFKKITDYIVSKLETYFKIK